MYLQFIFSNILCADALDLNNQDLQEYTNTLMLTSKGRSHTNRGGWQSEFVDQEPEMQPLVTEINNRLEALRSTINFRDDLELKVESMWINVNHPYSYNASHIHPYSYISGVYYVKVPAQSGDLILRNPSILLHVLTPKNTITSYNEHNSSRWNITPESGQLIMFPSWIEHEVGQNLSNEDRISIAFNTDFYTRG